MRASIIIPAYNSERTISECVKALKGQWPVKSDFEIIVVDDGSKDSTGKIAQRAGAKVFFQENAGPAKARNLGAKNSKGEVLVFTDADCVPEKEWLSEMRKPFEEGNVTGVQGAYRTRQKSLVAKFVQLEIEERYERMKKHAESLDWVGSYSAAYRRKDFFDAGGFDESFPEASGEDSELSYKLHKMGKKLVFNPEAIVYHTHPDTIAKYFWTKFYRAFYRVNLYSKHKDKAWGDSYTTNSIKIQITAGYLGITATLIVPFLYAAGQKLLALGILALNGILFALALLTMVKSSLYISKTDLKLFFFSMFMVQVRNAAFMLGLPAGLLKEKVFKRIGGA